MLAKFDISRPLTEAIKIEAPYSIIKQEMDYDWRPKFYNECIHYGNYTKDCKIKQALKQKKPGERGIQRAI